jgi:hypothetical protein
MYVSLALKQGIQCLNPTHHMDRIELFCSTSVGYIPLTIHELHLVETQPLPHSWAETLKQRRYNISQKITYQCVDSVPGNRLENILYVYTYIIDINFRKILGRFFAQELSCRADDLSRNLDIRICGGQNNTRTVSLWVHMITCRRHCASAPSSSLICHRS